MSRLSKVRKYSCLNCGTAFEVHPPDDLHTTASRQEKECSTRGRIKMEYKCSACGATNTIYWCRRRTYPDWYV